MPIYEYECTKCGRQTELFQKMTDKAPVKCDLCKSKMKKLISQSTFHLKGTGWYVTDYASKRSGSTPPPDSGGEKSASPGNEKGTSENSKKEASAAGGKD